MTEDDSEFPDDEFFSVTGGVLSFKSPPNFECPKRAQAGTCQTVNEEQNMYTVMVEASAGDNTNETIKTATEIVVVQVTNVDEMGEIELSTLAPKEDIPFTATLTDPDQGLIVATDLEVEWRWEKSQDGSTGWMLASASTTKAVIHDNDDKAQTTYTPGEEDAGYFLRVTASYDDDEGMGKEASVVSDNKVVMTDYVNRKPKFVDDMRTEEQITASEPATTSRSVMENVAGGTAVGGPVRATDTDAANNPEVLTYTMAATTGSPGDADPFEIDSSTGQISVKSGAKLDRERDAGSDLDADRDSMYQGTVTATDPGRAASTIDVTIEVTNVEEPPTLEATTYDDDGNEETGRTARKYPENTATSTSGEGLISTYSASDQEDNNATLQWTLTGRHADRFMTNVTEGAQVSLTFRSPPNYEPHTGRPSNNTYHVTVNVTDSTGKTDSRDVAVKVTNVDEAGTITLSHTRAEVDAPITARISDLDGVITSSVRWLWNLPNGATSSSATVRPANTGNAAVTVSYTDGEGPNKGSALGGTLINTVSVITVQPAEVPQRRPVFKVNGATTTSGTWPAIREDAQTANVSINLNGVNGFNIEDPGESVGDLNFTLGGDTGTFQIADRTSPVITLQPGASFNYEQKRSYRVTVRATDPSGDNTTLTLTIPIMDLNEPPVFAAGGEVIDYPEIKGSRPNTDRVFDYNATDPERQSLTWSLANQDDGDAFNLSQSGVLTFKEPPDFDDNDSYSVTIQVTDGADTSQADVIDPRPSTLPVTITIENVDEPGVVNLSPTRQPKEDEEITAVLTDPDGPVTGQSDDDPDGNPLTITENASTTWQWARSSSSNGPWTDIEASATATPPITSNTYQYTPRMADRGTYLRATASYSDGQGDDKTAQVVTDFAVLREDYVNMSPKFVDDLRSATSSEPSATTSREVAENAAAGTLVGAPVRAIDIGSDGGEEVLTYTLSDDGSTNDGDSDKFEIDRRTGQISVKDSDSLNYEDPDDEDQTDGGANRYVVIVTAKDPIGDATGTAGIIVTIEVTDVKERPTMAAETATEGLSSTTTDEHTPGGATTTDVLSLYRVNDDEDDLVSTTTLMWTVTGPDAGMFIIASTTLPAACNFRIIPTDDTQANCAELRFDKPSTSRTPPTVTGTTSTA